MLKDRVLRLQLNKFIFEITGGLSQLRDLGTRLERRLHSVGADAEQPAPALDDSLREIQLRGAGAIPDRGLWSVEELEHIAAGNSDVEVIAMPAEDSQVAVTSRQGSVNAVTLPHLVWSSLSVAVVSEWEDALRGFMQYLAHQLKSGKAVYTDANGRCLMDEFETFVNETARVDFDFAGGEWRDMYDHILIRDLIVQRGGRIEGEEANAAEMFIDRRQGALERSGDTFICRRLYAESIIDAAIGFFIVFDQTLRERFRHI